MGATLIALSVQKCNAGELAATRRLGGHGRLLRRARLMPVLAMGGASRVLGMTLPFASMVTASAALFLLVLLMGWTGVVRL